LEQRCSTLPLHVEQNPQNDKQKYAKIYRDSQARIIHSVRQELKDTITKLRAPSAELPIRALHSLPDVLAAFGTDLPEPAKIFSSALNKHGIQGQQNEGLEWTVLLTVLLSLMLTTQDTNDIKIFTLMLDLCSKHTLPTLEDGIEDVDTYTFVDENLGDFVHLPSADTNTAPTDILDDLGLTFVNQPADSTAPVFIKGRTENLGARIIMWAMKVVEKDIVPVFENGSIVRCLFARAQTTEDGQSDETWMYE
jgi:hypothetical protein